MFKKKGDRFIFQIRARGNRISDRPPSRSQIEIWTWTDNLG